MVAERPGPLLEAIRLDRQPRGGIAPGRIDWRSWVIKEVAMLAVNPNRAYLA